MALEEAGQFVVLGRERLAVSAPRRVELEQDVLLVVDDELLVVLRDDDGDGSFLLLRDRLGLDARLDLAGDKVVEELADGLFAQGFDAALLGEGELLVLLRVLDGEGRPVANLEVQVAAVLAEGLGIDGREVDSALVLLGNRLESLAERLALLGRLGEDVGERNSGL